MNWWQLEIIALIKAKNIHIEIDYIQERWDKYEAEEQKNIVAPLCFKPILQHSIKGETKCANQNITHWEIYLKSIMNWIQIHHWGLGTKVQILHGNIQGHRYLK